MCEQRAVLRFTCHRSVDSFSRFLPDQQFTKVRRRLKLFAGQTRFLFALRQRLSEPIRNA